jgi:hypothetical protein
VENVAHHDEDVGYLARVEAEDEAADAGYEGEHDGDVANRHTLLVEERAHGV